MTGARLIPEARDTRPTSRSRAPAPESRGFTPTQPGTHPAGRRMPTADALGIRCRLPEPPVAEPSSWPGQPNREPAP